MQNDELKKIISNLTLFATLNDETLDAITEKFSITSHEMGETILNKGDNGEYFYLVYSGQVKVLDFNADKEEIIIAQLGKGDFFGERSLLKGEPASSSIKTDTQTVLARLSKSDFMELIEKESDFSYYIQNYLFNRAVQSFLRKFSVFGELSAKETSVWIKSLQFENVVKQGDWVFKQGDEADKFYVIVGGRADVIINSDGKNQIVLTLDEGQFFGELAIINDAPRAAGIKALTDLKLVSMDKDSFKKLIDTQPALAQKIDNVIEMYKMRKQSGNEFGSKRSDVDELTPAEEDLLAKDGKYFEPYIPKKKGFFSSRAPIYPLIEQNDESDCAAACITMICKKYDKHVSMTKIRDIANVTSDGATLLSISYAAEKMGFNTRAMQASFEQLSSIALPAIIQWNDYHYVVLYEADKNGVVIADPAKGIIKVSKEIFNKSFNGFILIMEPTSNLNTIEETSLSLDRFLSVIRPHKRLTVEIFIVSLIVSLFGLATPIFTRLIIDNIIVHQNVSLLNTVVVGMLIITIFMGLSIALRTYLITYLSNKVQMSMLGSFYKHILSLPMRFFNQRKVGDIMARFNESSRVQHMLTSSSLGLFVDIIMLIVYVAVMFSFNVNLTLMIMGFISMATIITLSFTGMLKKLSNKSFAKSAQADAYLVESITGIHTIKSTASETTSRWKWEDMYVESLKVKSKATMINSMTGAVAQMLRTLSIMLLLWYGTYLVMEGEMTIGQVMAFNMIVMMVMAPINKILGMWNEVQETLMSVDRLNDIYDLPAEEKLDEESLQHLPTISGHIKFEKVNFAYSRAEKYILKNVTFEASPGQTIAIIGRSGSGKTTLINMLMRFFTPTSGKILIDGYNIHQMSIQSLRSQIGTVLQETHLFNGTIRENIALGKPDASFGEIVEAATLAAAHDFIKDLPMGYNTVVGERGMGLSGGQKQRLAIARALIGDPKILIFDEATSALDNESEKAIQTNLASITKNRTTFIIAHRLSTVKNADKILVLDKGAIVEEGNHDQLIKKRGLYFYLHSQSLSMS